MRVLFLVVLIGTTIETLTARSRAQIRLNRWRRKLRDHIVVIGYGVKGRSAVATLLAHDVAPDAGSSPSTVPPPDPTSCGGLESPRQDACS